MDMMGDAAIENIFSTTAMEMKPSAIREIERLSRRPNVISFAAGYPDPLALPVAEFAGSAFALGHSGMKALQYGDAEGYPDLREFLSSWLAPRLGGETKDLIVTDGLQNAFSIFCEATLDNGDALLVSEPIYSDVLGAVRARGALAVPVESDEQGIVPSSAVAVIEELERGGRRAKAIYAMPNYHNPTGALMSASRRAELAEALAGRSTVIFEADPFAGLGFDGEDLPTIYSFAQKCGALAVYAGTLSKILGPGVRLGWIVAPDALAKKIATISHLRQISPSVVAQALTVEYCRSGAIDGVLPRLREHYRRKKDAMLAAIERHFPDGHERSMPEGGFFVWVRLPGVDTNKIFMPSLDAGASFIPGAVFHAEHGGTDCMRLSFARASQADIETGIARIASTLPKKK